MVRPVFHTYGNNKRRKERIIYYPIYSIAAYWNIGRIIVEHEQENNERAAYGKQTLKELSKALTKELVTLL